MRAAFLLAMVAVAFIDAEHGIIPDRITLPGLVVGAAAAPLLGLTLRDALVGAACGGGFFLLLAVAYRRVRRREGLGGGDVKLGAMMGAFLGWQGVLLTIFLGSFLGTIVALGLLGSGRATRTTALPYGTFLAPAAGVALLLGPAIVRWYGSLLAG